MFKNLRISNFRAFGALEIPALGRINLITGKNNSGKTTLLESLFMLSGAGNPDMGLRVNAFRGGLEVAQGSMETAAETFLKPLFTNFDMERPVSIKGRHESHGLLSLRIELERPDTLRLPFDSPSRVLGTTLSRESALKFGFSKGSGKEKVGRVRFTDSGVDVEQPASVPPFQAVFLSSRSGSHQDDAVRLGGLRKQKQGDLVVDALRIVEPRLQSVEDNSASGVPMICGDVGLPELVPLPMMGEGMMRIARLVLAISGTPDGVVLVDEVENGLHHSVLPKVWGAIKEAAIRFNAQVVASTHSFECLEAAHQSLGEDDFLVHRLEAIGETIRCVTLGPDEITTMVAHNLEVR